MTDRRPSLIDQMALAAALEADLNFTSDDDGDSADEDDLLLGDDDMGDPSDQPARMVFNSDVIQEFGESEDEDEDMDDTVVIEIPAPRQNRPTTTNRARRDLDELASAPSGTSEDDDAFTDNPLPMGYQWHTPMNDTLDSGSFKLDAVPDSFDIESQSGELDRKPMSQQQQFRRTSFQSLPETSYNPDNENLGGPGPGMIRRNHSIRRPSIKITVAGSASAVSDEEDGDSNVSSTSTASSMFRFGRLSSIANSRRQNLSGRSGRSSSDVDLALDSLSTHETNSQWENVAAAVTIVAASEKASGNSTSRHRKFAVNDTVLVLLTLLNVTNVEDPKDTFTVAPVNRYGFPQGEGRTEEEKGGPYTFVLATVKHVHFDEDDRYYTVVRADTGTEQRADSGK